MILRENVPCRVPFAATAAIVLLAILVFPGWSEPPASIADSASSATAGESAATVEPGEQSALEAALEKSVSIEFENIHVSEIAEFMSDTYKVNIALDWRVVAPPPKHAAAPAPGFPGASGSPVPPTKTESAPALRDMHYVTDGMVSYVNLRDVPLRDALNALLRPLNLTFEAGPNVIWVSSAAQIEADAARPQPTVRSEDEKLLTALNAPVSMEFESIHLIEVTEFISQAYTMDFVVDNRAVAPPRIPGSPEPADARPYVTSGMVPGISLKNVPLVEALEVLVRGLNLTVTVNGTCVWISSYENTAATPETLAAAKAFWESQKAARAAALRTIAVPGVDGPMTPAPKPPPVSAKEPQAPPVSVLRIAEAPNGPRAQIRTEASTKWYRKGDAFESYRLLDVDPKANTVTVLWEKNGTSWVLSTAPGVGPQATALLDFKILGFFVSKPDNVSQISIQIGQDTQWYREGDSFGDYRVVRLDAKTRTIEIGSVKDGTVKIYTAQPDKASETESRRGRGAGR